MVVTCNLRIKSNVLCLILIFEARTAPAIKKVAAKCAEVIWHCAPAGQTTDISSYSSQRKCTLRTNWVQPCKTEQQQNKHRNSKQRN